MKLKLLCFLLLLTSCDFKKLQVTSIAKEHCSCLFITKQTKEYCLDIATHFLHKLRFQSLEIKENIQERTVRVSLGDEVSVYGMTTTQLGCRLRPPKHSE